MPPQGIDIFSKRMVFNLYINVIMSTIKRYSDAELEEFKRVIEEKLEKATNQYHTINNQLKEFAENNSGEYTKDLSDFSSSQGEVDMLNTMASRQLKYIQDLQAALVRVRNKSYGVCAVTGELIDKRRLMAVPTTTKSLLSKVEEGSTVRTPPVRISATEKLNKPKKTKVITKVMSKPSGAKGAKKPSEFDDLLNNDDEDDDDYRGEAGLGEDIEISEEFDD